MKVGGGGDVANVRRGEDVHIGLGGLFGRAGKKGKAKPWLCVRVPRVSTSCVCVCVCVKGGSFLCARV